MTREEIETRKAELEKRLVETIANVNALRGALQDCDFWLERLAAEEEAEADAAEASHVADVAYAEEPSPPHLLEDQ